MTQMGRIFADLIRVAPLDPPHPRSIALQTGKLNSPGFQRQGSTAGLRYETPGNSIASLYPFEEAILARNGNNPVFRLNRRITFGLRYTF